MNSRHSQPILVQPIRPDATHTLRHAVLRPHQQREEMAYEGDDLSTTIHLGAFATQADGQGRGPGGDDAQPIGVVTLSRQPMPSEDRANATPHARPHDGLSVSQDLRLRGMAVDPLWQGRGVGRALIAASIAAAQAAQGRRIWCNARVNAQGFYTQLGFTTQGERFDIPGIGPHWLMWIAVKPDPR